MITLYNILIYNSIRWRLQKNSLDIFQRVFQCLAVRFLGYLSCQKNVEYCWKVPHRYHWWFSQHLHVRFFLIIQLNLHILLALLAQLPIHHFQKIYPKMFNSGVDVMIISRESKMYSLDSHSKKYVSQIESKIIFIICIELPLK